MGLGLGLVVRIRVRVRVRVRVMVRVRIRVMVRVRVRVGPRLNLALTCPSLPCPSYTQKSAVPGVRANGCVRQAQSWLILALDPAAVGSAPWQE